MISELEHYTPNQLAQIRFWPELGDADD